ncbi:MMPL family transporter [Antrihabitans cavernicola]|uniref:MMPL family transporter n=2 Tax=Antrihabitans cavernicola TaxID=2495913 RepID=A0A5A7SC95_9NOCA|nr:MMPL family transporter [Spelaeibacter cavernicola]
MAQHRRVVIAVWILLTLACGLSYPILDARLQAPDLTVDHAESVRVDRLLGEHFPELGAEQSVIVYHSPTLTVDAPDYRGAVDRSLTTARSIADVRVLTGPVSSGPVTTISADRHTAFSVVGIDGTMAQRIAVAKQLQSDLRTAATRDVDVALTGYSAIQSDMITVERADAQRAETIGIPVAFALLAVGLGALVAAGIPILTAVAGLLLCIGALLVITVFRPLDPLALSTATMVGTGVGIDYAMFVVARFREQLRSEHVADRTDRTKITAAVGVSLDTAGKMVLASGVIVVISLCALVVVPAPVFRAITIGVSTSVVAAMLVATTLLPAVLAELGPAVNRGRLPRRVHDRPADPANRWGRWAHLVMRRPVVFALGALTLLLLAAAPGVDMRYGFDIGLPALHGTPSGRAAASIAADFAPGLLSPIDVIATGPNDTPLDATESAAAHRYVQQLAGDARIATTLTRESGGRVMVSVVPAVPVDSTAATDLVRELRERAHAVSDNGVKVSVGGTTAALVEMSDVITARLPWVIGLVLASSLIFLTLVFRSVVLPLKAIVMNLFATGAALGITVAVFQWGYGESVFGFQSPGFLQVFLPITVFAILFGLSMDYEVFLIRRIKENWDAADSQSDRTNRDSVATGIQQTAGPITAAAVIMVVVFGSFLTADVLELKQLGFALAVAIAIDAVVIRLLLVPSLLRLLGHWNWWFPGDGSATGKRLDHSAATASRATPSP